MTPARIAARAVKYQERQARAGVHVSTSQAVRFVERQHAAARARLSTAVAHFAEHGTLDPTMLKQLARAYQLSQRALGKAEPTAEEAEAFVLELWDEVSASPPADGARGAVFEFDL